MMTIDEERGLRDLGRDLAAAARSPWEPACITRTFATTGSGVLTLTMQQWIDLEAICSPLLTGELPERLEEMQAAAAIFDLRIDPDRPGEVGEIAEAMREAVHEAFALALPMRPPEMGDVGNADDDGGFGTWVLLWAFLVAQCRITPETARQMPVGQVYVLMAAHRRNQGWETVGAPYRLRELEEKEVGDE